ncbi:hypothetical protein OOZ19_03005 [Saccharopolyspora sp. NFXS83]|uniref:hypothetical protein n=1 Tax=Saccharopolyspora sp. NFXS83 TaxID=2993560 RepID=UPI00224B5EA6|nr:hypothetical protein [Saccharopolyspora sp. NFXS83]MCX2729197.1 hypothetical protein [Saccharopolyspora sp. NFXS83]
MHEKLTEPVSPQLSAPVTRKPVDAVTVSEIGAGQSMANLGPVDLPLDFAADDDD